MALILALPVSVAAAPAVAWYYGADPPFPELAAYDVVEPAHGIDPDTLRSLGSEPYARVGVAEASDGPARAQAYPAQAYPKDTLTTRLAAGEPCPDRDGRDFGRQDPDRPDYDPKTRPPKTRAAKTQGRERGSWTPPGPNGPRPSWTVVTPLWARGYHGFFLDAIDASLRAAHNAADRERRRGLIATVRELKRRFPEARVLFNGGFELLPETAGLIDGVAASALFHAWDADRHVYSNTCA